MCIVRFIFLKWKAFKFSGQIFLIFFPYTFPVNFSFSCNTHTIDTWTMQVWTVGVHSPVFFVFFFLKRLIVSSWSRVLGKATDWLKSCLVTAGRGSDRSPDSRGCQKVPQRLLGSRCSKLSLNMRLLIRYRPNPAREPASLQQLVRWWPSP